MSINPDIDTLAGWLRNAKRTVFFGGAGISTESGIPDFRSAAGLYVTHRDSAHSPEYLLSHECLVNDPDEFFRFHRTELVHPEAKPNPAHLALAKMEAKGIVSAVVTQNIDGLHQLAGSKNVLELHGSVWRNHCRNRHSMATQDIPELPTVPHCPTCGEIMRPDVVLYNESLDYDVIEASVQAISETDVLIVGGTSLNVYPAAGMLDYYSGDKLALVNLEETPRDRRANLVIHEKLGTVMAALCESLWPGESLA